MIILSKNEKEPLILSENCSKIWHIEPILLVWILAYVQYSTTNRNWLYFILVAAGGPRYGLEGYEQDEKENIMEEKDMEENAIDEIVQLQFSIFK